MERNRITERETLNTFSLSWFWVYELRTLITSKTVVELGDLEGGVGDVAEDAGGTAPPEAGSLVGTATPIVGPLEGIFSGREAMKNDLRREEVVMLLS